MAPRSIFTPGDFYLARTGAFLSSVGRSEAHVQRGEAATFSATVPVYFPREQQRASSAAFVECKQGVWSLRRARKLRREPHRPFCPCTRLVRSLLPSLFHARLFLPSSSFIHLPPSPSRQAYAWSPSSSHPESWNPAALFLPVNEGAGGARG